MEQLTPLEDKSTEQLCETEMAHDNTAFRERGGILMPWFYDLRKHNHLLKKLTKELLLGVDLLNESFMTQLTTNFGLLLFLKNLRTPVVCESEMFESQLHTFTFK